MKVALLTVGSEILDGRIVDTNTHFLTARLAESGIAVSAVMSAPDIQSEIVSAIGFLSGSADKIIMTGGLGPTSDDLAREAAADFFSVPLRHDPGAEVRLKECYARRGRDMDPSNLRQCYFPEGADIVANPVGTAEGFKIRGGAVELIALPGVPRELYRMFDESVLPDFREKLGAQSFVLKKTFHIFGLPESSIGSMIKSLPIPPSVEVIYQAGFPVVKVVLKSTIAEQLDGAEQLVSSAIGVENIFSREEKASLPETVGVHLSQTGKTIAVAESCTAGLLGYYLTRTPGSSSFFLGGIQCYSNNSKVSLLDVGEDVLQRGGSVSREIAGTLASNVRKRLGAHIGISITGLSGPGGDLLSSEAVGTFYIGIADERRSEVHRFFINIDRDSNRIYAAHHALNLLRAELLAAGANLG